MQKLLRFNTYSYILGAALVTVAGRASAATSCPNGTELGVGIGNTTCVTGSGNTQLENYISAIVTWADVALPILAVGMIIYGGIKYIYSMGSPDQVKDAKSTIASAIAGLFLLIIANVLLVAINPNLAGPIGRIFR